MSKAVEKAYEAYPLNEGNRLNHNWNAKRVGFQQGYHQAEKDLALTADDILYIIDNFLHISYNENCQRMSMQHACEYILEMYNKRK